jgi:hypothetical protein
MGEGYRAKITGYVAVSFSVECTQVMLTDAHTVAHAWHGLHASTLLLLSQISLEPVSNKCEVNMHFTFHMSYPYLIPCQV